MLLPELSTEAPNSGPLTFLRPAPRRKKGGSRSYDAVSSTPTPGVGSPPPGYGSLPLGPGPPDYGSPAVNEYGIPTWPSPEAPNRPQERKRKRILLISACLGIAAIIATAIALGVHFGSSRNSNNKSDDHSTFTKDPKLKNSFYGVAYDLTDPLQPNCSQTLADAIEDVQLLSQITTRIRLYNSDCNQPGLVLEAIKQTRTNLKVFPAIYVSEKDEVSYQRQRTSLQQALQTYGKDNVLGIIVGNEFMLNYTLAHNATDVNSTVGQSASAILKGKIADIRQMLTSIKIDVPVGTSDVGGFLNVDLLSGVDFGMGSVHPWFGRSSVQDAANWTFNAFNKTNVNMANSLENKPQMYIAETGWPTYSTTPEGASYGVSAPSESNLQIYIDNFVCTANTQSIKYFFFEFTDSLWMEQRFPGVDGFWGLFNKNKTLKALTLPDCSHD